MTNFQVFKVLQEKIYGMGQLCHLVTTPMDLVTEGGEVTNVKEVPSFNYAHPITLVVVAENAQQAHEFLLQQPGAVDQPHMHTSNCKFVLMTD